MGPELPETSLEADEGPAPTSAALGYLSEAGPPPTGLQRPEFHATRLCPASQIPPPPFNSLTLWVAQDSPPSSVASD